jgi:Holliday junction resolvase RusA-like endonuclease
MAASRATSAQQSSEPAVFTVTVPWTPGVLKNGRWRRSKTGIYLDPEAASWHHVATLLIRRAVRGLTLGRDQKLWLALHVTMPHRRSDTINVLDAVADAVQAATGINDRQYRVALLDGDCNRSVEPVIRLALATSEVLARAALRQRAPVKGAGGA